MVNCPPMRGGNGAQARTARTARMARPTAGSGSPAPAVDRAAGMLLALGAGGREASLTDLARRLRIQKSSAHGILAVLARRRFVERDPVSRRYRLGPALLALARSAPAADVPAIAAPHLVRLCRLSGETATLHLRDGAGSIIAASRESPRQLKVAAPVGHPLPPFAGSVGKVLAAFGRSAAAVPASLPRFTPRSITGGRRYARELVRVRRAGLALDDGEYLPGVCAISAPVFAGAAPGPAIGALSIVAVRARVSPAALRRLGRPLRTAARAISAALWAPPAHPAAAAAQNGAAPAPRAGGGRRSR
jgi:DNA-binding IclR family transcriptional regulator